MLLIVKMKAERVTTKDCQAEINGFKRELNGYESEN